MSDTDEAGPTLSLQAREVLRLLRMAGATPEAAARLAVLRNMWARHLPKADPEKLDVALAELQRAGLVSNKTEGITPTAKALAIR